MCVIRHMNNLYLFFQKHTIDFMHTAYTTLPYADIFGFRVGGLGGEPISNVCSRITGIPQEFWQRNMSTCMELVNRDVEAWVCVVFLIIVFFCVKFFLKKIYEGRRYNTVLPLERHQTLLCAYEDALRSFRSDDQSPSLLKATNIH